MPDPEVPILSAVIEVETVDARRLARDHRMTAEDYNYDSAGVSKLARRIGNEQIVPQEAFTLLEQFADSLPGGSTSHVFRSLQMLETVHSVERR